MRSRPSSRSITSAPNAASTQNIRKMSSIEVRLCTNSKPSRASSAPATQPSKVERNIRRAMRAISRTDRLPTIAAENRQPSGLFPNIASPTAIIHLPSGGWTMNAGFLSCLPASISTP